MNSSGSSGPSSDGPFDNVGELYRIRAKEKPIASAAEECLPLLTSPRPRNRSDRAERQRGAEPSPVDPVHPRRKVMKKLLMVTVAVGALTLGFAAPAAAGPPADNPATFCPTRATQTAISEVTVAVSAVSLRSVSRP